ncbi:hypothetical protein HY486_01850 [Candidatus Woesearchaeota archaeon]|nr:hypothetical protein [Candidatus Woesearchaeota archaeon]
MTEHKGLPLVILGIVAVLAVFGLVLMFNSFKKTGNLVVTTPELHKMSVEERCAQKATMGIIDKSCDYLARKKAVSPAMQGGAYRSEIMSQRYKQAHAVK